jgi:hypothetical protein
MMKISWVFRAGLSDLIAQHLGRELLKEQQWLGTDWGWLWDFVGFHQQKWGRHRDVTKKQQQQELRLGFNEIYLADLW